jgi:hypothetical protein
MIDLLQTRCGTDNSSTGHRLCLAELAAARVEKLSPSLLDARSDRPAIAVISRISRLNAVNQENLREPHMRGSGDAADYPLDSDDIRRVSARRKKQPGDFER